jgi:SAM-dependent methyltransferase
MLDAINAVSPWHLLYRERTAKDLQAVLPVNGRVLDAGGGTGIFAAWLVELGHSVTVVDIVPEMLDLVAEKRRGLGSAGKRLEIVCGDIECLSELDLGDFDAAICTQVLNFCRHPADVFSGIAGVLRPGAPFVCDIDGAYRWSLIELLAGHAENARDILCEGTDAAKNIVGTDYWFIKHSKAAQQLEATGFDVVDMRGLLHFAPYLHVLASSEAFLHPEEVPSEGSMFVQPGALKTLREMEQYAADIMPVESAGWVQLVATLNERARHRNGAE